MIYDYEWIITVYCKDFLYNEMMITMMMMIINCFCGMVDQRAVVITTTSRHHDSQFLSKEEFYRAYELCFFYKVLGVPVFQFDGA